VAQAALGEFEVKKIYIAGKINGLPWENVKAKFDTASAMVRNLGHTPLCPTEMFPDGRIKYKDGVVVVELDGKQFHDPDVDALRDSQIIQHVSAIVRIPFKALWDTPRATFRVLNEWFPERFDLGDDPHVITAGQLEYELYLKDGRPLEVYRCYGRRASVGRVVDYIGAGYGQEITVQRGKATDRAILDRI
jgi:hypothetical protein